MSTTVQKYIVYVLNLYHFILVFNLTAETSVQKSYVTEIMNNVQKEADSVEVKKIPIYVKTETENITATNDFPEDIKLCFNSLRGELRSACGILTDDNLEQSNETVVIIEELVEAVSMDLSLKASKKTKPVVITFVDFSESVFEVRNSSAHAAKIAVILEKARLASNATWNFEILISRVFNVYARSSAESRQIAADLDYFRGSLRTDLSAKNASQMTVQIELWIYQIQKVLNQRNANSAWSHAVLAQYAELVFNNETNGLKTDFMNSVKSLGLKFDLASSIKNFLNRMGNLKEKSPVSKKLLSTTTTASSNQQSRSGSIGTQLVAAEIVNNFSEREDDQLYAAKLETKRRVLEARRQYEAAEAKRREYERVAKKARDEYERYLLQQEQDGQEEMEEYGERLTLRGQGVGSGRAGQSGVMEGEDEKARNNKVINLHISGRQFNLMNIDVE
jgi:hypothetical protein